ncbi:LysR family transcriptional regulator [Streptomyces prunicolor]|uniref:LysR family transcriptional regulator n=1 Tax=Streptomyces prunicolor TaxID=67348 RepID=UPI00224FC63A|nr:LysR family transcriptional regulator [Streptomyces prunicolor]MCX5239310.1 LysR family transcriptional regulator [Streptomyces prunicolor]
MDLRHLKYFLAVAETRNFTQAAASCYVAQSALSQQIARLEKDVGAQLFSRTSRSVRLTAAGELLEPLARRILADVDTAKAALDALSGLRRGRLRLGLVQTRASSVDLVEVMANYHARYPGIDFHVTNAPSAEMAAAVLAGDLDIAIVGLSPRQIPDGLDHQVLAADPLVLIVPADHALADREAVDLADLPESHQLIQFTRGSGLRRQVEAAFARAGVEPGQHFQVGQIQDMIRLAARGIGVTVVPRSSVFLDPVPDQNPPDQNPPDKIPPDTEDALPYGARALRIADEAAVHTICAVHDSKRLAPAAAAFLEVVERHAIRD